jgi:hypothetical protein
MGKPPEERDAYKVASLEAGIFLGTWFSAGLGARLNKPVRGWYEQQRAKFPKLPELPKDTDVHPMDWLRGQMDRFKLALPDKSGTPYRRPPPRDQPPPPDDGGATAPVPLPLPLPVPSAAPAAPPVRDVLAEGMAGINTTFLANREHVARTDAEVAARLGPLLSEVPRSELPVPRSEPPPPSTPALPPNAPLAPIGDVKGTPVAPVVPVPPVPVFFDAAAGQAAFDRLKAKARAKAAQASVQLAPVREVAVMSAEEAAANRAARAQLAARLTSPTGPTGPTEPAAWRPPRAPAVAPVAAGGEGIFTLADAIDEAGKLSAPNLKNALADMSKGVAAPDVVAKWSGGVGEYDALPGVLEEIAAARDAKDWSAYRKLARAYNRTFPGESPHGIDQTMDTLRRLAEEGRAPAGGVPENEAELIGRAWEDAARGGGAVDRDATALAQEAADFEAFSNSLKVESRNQKAEIFSGDQKLGDLRTIAGRKVLVPTAEGERLPLDYQREVLAKAGIEMEHGMAMPARFLARQSELDQIAQDLYGRPYSEVSDYQQGHVQVTLEAEDATLPRRQQPAIPARRERGGTREPAGKLSDPPVLAPALSPVSSPASRELGGGLVAEIERLTEERDLLRQRQQWLVKHGDADRASQPSGTVAVGNAMQSAQLDRRLIALHDLYRAWRQAVTGKRARGEERAPQYARAWIADVLKSGAEGEHGMPDSLPGLGTSAPEFDPTILRDLTAGAGSLIEAGAVDFPAFAAAMNKALAGEFPQYYHAAYEQVRFNTETWALRQRMTPQEETELYDHTGQRTDPNRPAGGEPQLSGTMGGTSRPRRPGLRVVDFRDLPAPRPLVRSGEYVGPSGAGIDEVQRFAVNAALSAFEDGKPAYLLGDGTGVGKTGTELAIAAQAALRTKLPSLIVTQSQPIIENRFKQDAIKLGVPTQAIEFLTYTDLSLGKVPAKQYGVVIYDEAHNLKNAGSLRETFAKQVNAKNRVFATATPMDGPTHASYFLAELTGKTKQQIADKLGFHYEQQTVNGQIREFARLNKNTQWADVIDQIKRLRNQAVRDGQLIRREYPFFGNAALREAPVYPKEIGLEQQKIIGYWNQLIAKARPGSNYKRNLAGQKTLELSRWAEIQKLPAILQAVLEDYAAGKHVIVYAEGYNPTFIKGAGKTVPGFLSELGRELDKRGIRYAKVFEDNATAKARAAEDFQRRGVKVLLATPKSGGAGLDMDDQIGNAPRQAHAATLNFSADVFDQMLGRVSRRNTASPADFHVWINRDSFADGRRVAVADRKLKVLRNIQAGEDLDTSEFETLGEHGMPDFQGGFSFDAAESPAEAAARLAAEQSREQKAESRNRMAARAQERLTGTTGDLGQGDLLGAPQDLWAGREAAPLEAFARKSAQLQQLLRTAGFVKGDGISGPGLKLVSQVAKDRNLRDWPHTRTLEDYDRLIAAVAAKLGDEVQHGAPAVPAGGVPGLPVEMNRTVPGQASIPEINAALEAVSVAAGGNTPIRSGRFYAKARGIYKERSEVIRLRAIDDLPAAAHELAHDLSKQVFGSVAEAGTKGGPAAMAEMERLGRALYGSTKPIAGYAAEGWAEFLRTWLSADNAATIAPNLNRWFETDFLAKNRAVADALGHARALLTTNRLSGAAARAQAQLAREPGALRRIAGALGRFVGYQAQMERFAPIEALVKAAEAKGGRLAPSDNPFLLASWKRGSAGATVERMATAHMIDVWGNPTGPSLKEAFAPVQGQRAEVLLLAFAKAARARWTQSRMQKVQGQWVAVAANPVNPGISLADANHIIATLSTPARDLAVQRWREWHNGLLDYLVQADPSMADLVDRWKASDFYMPLARMIDPKKAKQAAAAASSNPMFRMRGSGLPVKDLLDQTMINAARLVNKANRALVTGAIVKLANVEGMGHLIEAIPRGRVRNLVSLEQIRAQLEDLGVDTSMVPADKLLEYWTPADLPKGTAPIIAVGRAGNRRWFQVSPELYESLDGLQTWSLKNAFPGLPHLGTVLDLVLGTPARAFRLGTTGLRPAFSLVTNPSRDLASLLAQTSVSPAKAAAAYPAALAGVIREGLGGQAGPYVQAFYDLGAHMGQPLGLDISHTKRVSNELFHGRILRVIKNPVDHLRQVLSITEAGPRVAELTAKARELGWTPGTPMTPDQAVALGLAAKRVTTDFSAMGDVSQILNQAVPFYNPAIQGLRAFSRAFKEHPARSVLLGSSIFLVPTLLNWWANKDKEWYRALPYRERAMFTWLDDGTNLWKIARPFEWGMAFMAIPEALFDSWYRHDPRAVREVLGTTFDQLNPLDWPVLLKQYIAQASNWESFWKRPIIPERLETATPAQQAGPYTTRLALALNRAFPTVSPMRVDAFIRGYFGGAGPDALSLLGLGSPGGGRDWELSDLPAFGVLFRRGGQFNAQNQYISDFYDRYLPARNEIAAWQMQAKAAQMQGKPVPTAPSAETRVRAEIGEAYAPIIRAMLQVAGATQNTTARASLYRDAGEQARSALVAFGPEK